MTSVQGADSAFLRGLVGMFGLSWLFPAPQPIGQATLARHKATLQELTSEARQQLEKIQDEDKRSELKLDYDTQIDGLDKSLTTLISNTQDISQRTSIIQIYIMLVLVLVVAVIMARL